MGAWDDLSRDDCWARRQRKEITVVRSHTALIRCVVYAYICIYIYIYSMYVYELTGVCVHVCAFGCMSVCMCVHVALCTSGVARRCGGAAVVTVVLCGRPEAGRWGASAATRAPSDPP